LRGALIISTSSCLAGKKNTNQSQKFEWGTGVSTGNFEADATGALQDPFRGKPMESGAKGLKEMIGVGDLVNID